MGESIFWSLKTHISHKMKVALFVALAVLATAAHGKSLKTMKVDSKKMLPGIGRIVNGDDANVGDFPFIVRLSIDNAYLCGGTLIAPDLVLTAAHCVYNSGSAEVTAGDALYYQSEPTEQTRQSSMLMPNSAYGPFFITNDVGLIQLARPFDINENVSPIALASASPVAGDQIIAAGWGKTCDSCGIATHLQQATLNVLDVQDCVDYYGSNTETKIICLNSKQDATGTCNGDSGGPSTNMDKSEVLEPPPSAPPPAASPPPPPSLTSSCTRTGSARTELPSPTSTSLDVKQRSESHCSVVVAKKLNSFQKKKKKKKKKK